MATGLFGKLPSRGDFVRRGLSDAFVASWDPWVSAGLAQLAVAWGPAWSERYREAPVWRFALASGVCGERAWAGVMAPAVDAAGRAFPLTIAVDFAETVASLRAAMLAGRWFAEVEHFARRAASESDIDPDGLHLALGALEPRLTHGLLTAEQHRALAAGEAVAHSGVDSVAASVDAFGSLAWPAAAQTLWWSPERATGMGWLSRVGLPTVEEFGRLYG